MAHYNDIMMEFPDKIKDVRGKGLLTAFEMQNSPKLDGHHVSVELLKQGVYAKETHHSTVRIAPALTIALTVGTAVLGTVITSSPLPISADIKAI